MTEERDGQAVRGLVFGLLFAVPIWLLIAFLALLGRAVLGS